MAKVSLWDEFLTNEKVAGLKDPAFRLYVLSIVYSGKELTDGHIVARALATLAAWTGRAVKRPAAELVERGFFEPDGEGGFWIHDYLKHQRSRAQTLADRDDAASRQRKSREARAAINESLNGDSHTVTHTVTDGVSHGVSHRGLTQTLPLTPESKTQSPGLDLHSEGGHDFTIQAIASTCRADSEGLVRLRRAAKGCSEAHLVGALEACKGPGVNDRLAVALSELKKRRNAA